MKTKLYVTYSDSEQEFVDSIEKNYSNIEVIHAAKPMGDFKGASAMSKKREIKNALKRASYLLCVVGKNTGDDEWVAFEISEAKNIQKTVMYMRPTGDNTSDMPISIRALKKVTDWDDAKISALEPRLD